MIILGLDTTTRAGSIAMARDRHVIETYAGDPERTHGERLPGEIAQLLERHSIHLTDVDLFSVASGPGSFTGLRIGIATIQGLAFASGRRVVPISALDALARAATERQPARTIAVWMDAQRGEVFSALYDACGNVLVPPSVDTPAATLARWKGTLLRDDRITFVGDGARRSADLIRATLHDHAVIVDPTPLVAPTLATLAAERAGSAVAPHAIVPLYIRRPDAELARERRAAARGSEGQSC